MHRNQVSSSRSAPVMAARTLGALLASAAVLGPAVGWAQTTPPAPKPAPAADAACAALRPTQTFSDVANRLAQIPDAPTSIVSARIVPAERGLPEYCRVEGQIAPTIGFLLKLPTSGWNGKLMMGGCGGPCGQYLSDRLDPAFARRYAVVSTDMGHKGIGWAFAYQNLQGQIDFGSRATHLTAVAAKEIIDLYYARPASLAYFNGCSTGGRQGMVEAQRFPEDFNGIIAGAPPYFETGDTPLFLSWGARANLDADGKPILDAAKLPLIHEAVLAACDPGKGAKGGMLLNPAACAWDPASLACKPGQAADACLSAAEVGVVRKIYAGATNAKGRALYFGMPRGSELNWAPGFVNSEGRPGDYLSGFGGAGNSLMTYGAFFYSPGPKYSERDFDYDRDVPRLAVIEALYNAQNPDLRAFRDAGGKLILYHGWNDNQIPAGASVDYYETATRTAGGPAATRAFFRLFLLPGVGHCRGGPGGSEVDWISALEGWVEKGVAPDQVVANRMKTEPFPTVEVAPGETVIQFPRHPLDPSTVTSSRVVLAYAVSPPPAGTATAKPAKGAAR
ncbi:tannase/feruloyl esterase family alpha/beta hydrolase [Phenylobacterium sp.]|uniref:tannase/feruloyl esterase family alpha/beta hydrolase n=1 Tax=Phenylobacterium sp. TaxID=1871053 RepID=UPI0025F5CF2C|nr:tannase/feruloyl esterase family alpha/beta hydrolase [Phenylobacterium sp.]